MKKFVREEKAKGKENELLLGSLVELCMTENRSPVRGPGPLGKEGPLLRELSAGCLAGGGSGGVLKGSCQKGKSEKNSTHRKARSENHLSRTEKSAGGGVIEDFLAPGKAFRSSKIIEKNCWLKQGPW